MNSFFCSVELLDHPELKDKPVAVAGRADERHGIILAKNQLAKKAGVATPEPIYQAMQKCPDLVLLDPHYDKYQYFCNTINHIYLQYTDLVEPFSVDESWLDVTGSLKLFGKSAKDLADEIRERVYKETGLTLSAGVSFNKTFAKMGSDYKKPFATTEITRENYQELLWPLPAGDLFFVGKASAARLRSMNIKTIGDIAKADEKLLASVFGSHGLGMKLTANGIDDDPVLPYDSEWKRKSVGNGITFKRNISGPDVRPAVGAIADRVATRLRKYGIKAGGVKVDIKDPDFIQISRQKQLVNPTNLASEIAGAAMEIIDENWITSNPIRLITITGFKLYEAGDQVEEQLTLFETEDDIAARDMAAAKEEKLENTLDAIRKRLGSGAIVQGSLVGNDFGVIIEKE